MATFRAYDYPDLPVVLQDNLGFGIPGVPVAERTANIDPSLDIVSIDAGGRTLLLDSTVPAVRFSYYANHPDYFVSDGSQTAMGVSGHFMHENMFLDGPQTVPYELLYTLQVGDLDINQYFRSGTWSTVFSGNDELFLTGFSDVAYAYAGDDIVNAGDGFDTIYGGDNNDWIDGGANADVLNGDAGFDTIYGGGGHDYIQGGSGADVLYGDNGNDDIRGGKGHDLIKGGAGNDMLRGALGTDTLTGGSGADVFVFESALDGAINIDTITDFEQGIDRLYLSRSVFGAFEPGRLVDSTGYLSIDSEGFLIYDADRAGPEEGIAFLKLIGGSNHVPYATDVWII